MTIVTLYPGTFDSFFRGFLSPLLESLAPKMPSLTPAAPSVFIGLAHAPPHAVSFHTSWILKFTTTERALKWTHIHPVDILSTLSPPCPPRWNIALSTLREAWRARSFVLHQTAVFAHTPSYYTAPLSALILCRLLLHLAVHSIWSAISPSH